MSRTGSTHVPKFGDKVRKARLLWFGHMKGKDAPQVCQRSLNMSVAEEKQSKLEVRGLCRARHKGVEPDGGKILEIDLSKKI